MEEALLKKDLSEIKTSIAYYESILGDPSIPSLSKEIVMDELRTLYGFYVSNKRLIMQIDKKLEFERQCLRSGIWTYEGEYRPNVYPFSPMKREINFRLIDRDEYTINSIEDKYVIFIPIEDGDIKVEIKKIYL